MVTYEIQGPDGKTYSIDGPEGASREEVIAAIQARMQTPPSAPAPAAAAKPTTEVAPVEEAGKGARSGISALKSMWEGLGASKDANVALGYAQRLSVYDQIDRGILNKSNLTPDKVGGDMSPQFRDAQIYLASDEGKRQQLRNRAAGEIKNRKELFDTAVKTIQQYQEENKKNKGRTENLTDIEGAKDFANWLSFNLGSGAVQLAPVMTAAVLTGGPGAFAVGTGMELGGQSLNRLEFILNKTKAEKDPQKRADDVLKYVQKTNDTNLMAAIAAGAVDVLLGPVADVIKQPITQAVKERTRKEIAKQAAKAVPRQTAEEGVAGGTQETISIMAERALEEQGGPAFTKENIKRVVNAAAAEAVGGGGASVTLGGIRTAVGPTAEAPEAAPRVEPTIEPEAPAAPTAPVDPRKEALVKSYIDQGFMPDDADLLATQALGGLEPTPPAAPTPTVAPAVAEEAPAFLPRELAGAKPRYAFGNKLFELNFESDIDRAAYIAAQGTPSKRDADYVNFVARATGMSEPEIRAHGRAVRDSIKAQARASETGGRLEVAEVARAKKPVAPPAAPAGVPPLELPTTDAEGRAIQRRSAEDEARTMAGRAERVALQMEGDNVPTTEPPPFVTEPSTDERGILVPSAEAGAAELPTTPIDRGLGAASSAARQLAGREELERAALVEQQELAERAISRGFAREPYPDLGLTLGASWVRDTLATNPTPEAYQEAAYARLEELGGLPPRDARPAFERRAPAAPMVGERPEERVEPAVEAAPTEAVEAPVATEVIKPVKETKTTHTVYDPETGEEGTLEIFRPSDDPTTVTDVRIKYPGMGIGKSFGKQGVQTDEQVLNGFEAIDTITTEKPRGPEAPKAVKAKEERPAQPTEAAAPLELEAGRKEELEVDPSILDTVARTSPEKLKQQLIAEFGATAAGEPRKRAPGGGREVSEAAKTGAERVEQAADVINLTRDTLAEISAVRKLERSTTGDFFGIAARTAEEKDYREALRDLSIETLRVELYKKAQKFKSRPIVAYAQAGKYIKSLKPAEQERAKALAEKREDYTELPPLPTTRSSPAQRKKAIEKIRAAEEEVVAEPVKKARPAKETEVKEELKPVLRPVTEAFGTPLWLAEYQGLWEEKGKAAREKEKAPEEKTRWTDYNAQLLRSSMSKADRAATMLEEEPVGDAQEELQDAAIHDQLDDEDKAVIAEHYGETSYNEVAKRKFVEDVVKAMNEGLDAVSRVLHDIIKRLQAGMLAAIMVVNTSFITPTIPVATPTTLSRTVQVRATVPADVVGMSEGGRQAYATIYPAVEKGLKATNKLFIITDKPSANLYVFNPDGSLLTQSKVLLGKTMGDFYRGNTEVVQNRITPAGLFNLGLRDAARGGSEAKTAGAYDYGKVFVLDKAIDGEYSVTLFHSVWTKEKDAKQRLAALEKPGPLDSRYSFGCINVPKGVYGNLLAGHENQIDGAKMFVVPENPAHTMDFINGKAAVAEDIVRQQVAPVTKTVTEKVPPTAPKEERKEEVAAIREEKPVERRGMRAAPKRGRAEDDAQKIADGTFDAKDAKKMTFDDLIALTQAAMELAAGQHTQDTDKTFRDLDTLAGALAYIAQTGTPLDAGMAEALLTGENGELAKNVALYTVKPLREGQEPTAFHEALSGAYGVYASLSERTGGAVLLEDSGKKRSGLNNLTVLHEGIHAVTSLKLFYIEDMEAAGRLNEVDEQLLDAYDDLVRLMAQANEAAADMMRNRTLPKEVAELARRDAFTDVHEFVAYGLTDANMKAFLLTVPGIGTKKSGLSRFVSALLKLLQIGKNNASALRDLVIVSGKLMEIKTPEAKARAEAFRAANIVADQIKQQKKIIPKAQEQNKTVKKAEEKLKAAASATEVVEQMGSLMKVAKDPTLWVDYLRVNYRNIATPVYKGYIAALPVNVLVDLAEAMGIGNVKQLNAGVQKMHTFRIKTLNKVQELAVPWIKLNANEQKKLADVMHMATDLQIDPAKDKSNAALYMRYNALTPEAKAIYTKVRDFYRGNYDLYRALLAKRVADTPINNADRQNLMNAIKETYEVGAKIEPYFPLMRYGEYWVSFGKGVNKEFYMFESPGERDLFRDRRAAELKRRDPNIEIEAGDNIEEMRKNLQGDSANLKALFGLVDSMQVSDPDIKNTLKNEIFQLHLLTLPEASFRKQFIRRKGTTGFSGDALRNFIVSGTKFANQIARIKYGPEIRNSLSAAEASLEGDPDRPKKGTVVNELGLRVKDELEPEFKDSGVEKAARVVNKAAFIWLLTSVHSAANQLFSVVNFTLPTLAKYHGWGPATAQLMQTVASMYTQVGTTSLDKDGNVTYTPPTMMNNRSLRLSPIEQRAYQAMLDRGITDATRTQDLFLRKGQPSATYNDKTAKIVNALGSLFHTAESLSREVTFMAAFRLNIRKMPFEDAVENAIHTVNESLFDYSTWNTPRILKSAPARIVTQFMKFPLFVSLYLARNARIIFKPMDGETRTGAAKALFGTLGLTGVLAGVSGLPMFSTLMGIAQGLRNLMEDDDEEVVLEEENLMRWFRNVWLPETFGETTVMGMNLAELIDSGVLNAATGYDFASGISLNNMWFRDAPEASSWKDAYASTIMSLLGPGVGLGESWWTAIDDINKGDMLKGFEKLIPALFRGTLTAARYKTEGAMDAALRPIKEADEFTNAQLLMQAMGFKTTGLAKVMEDNFAIRQMQQKILQKRTSLISNLDRAATMDREADFEKVMDQIDEYNAKYPSPDLRIDYEDIKRAMERRRKAMQMTERGMIQDPRFRDLEVLRERGLELIEKEAAE